MPTAQVNGCRLHYEIAGPANAKALVLSNSLGTHFSMWDAQIPELRKKFRVLRYDTRGHGQSEVTPGPYSFEQLGRDVLALADAVDVGTFSFCGLSMGGVVGMWLGTNAGKRLHKLALCSTAAKIGNAQTWNARIDAVRKGGMKAVAPATMDRWFTARSVSVNHKRWSASRKWWKAPTLKASSHVAKPCAKLIFAKVSEQSAHRL